MESIDDLVDIISNNSISSCLLPEPVNLDEVCLIFSFYRCVLKYGNSHQTTD